MNIERTDGSIERKENLTADEVLTETERALADPDVTYIDIHPMPNRAMRRRPMTTSFPDYPTVSKSKRRKKNEARKQGAKARCKR